MNGLEWTKMFLPPRRRVKLFHEIALIVGDGYTTLHGIQNIGELTMFLIGHFIAIRLRIASCIVNIRRITIKESVFRIIEPDNINSWTVFDLYAQKPFRNVCQTFNATKPATDDSTHPISARVDAVGPSTDGCRLRQASSNLSSAHIKTPSSLKSRQVRIQLTETRG